MPGKSTRLDVEDKDATLISFGPVSIGALLQQAPTPLVILAGPEHHIDLINPLYVRLMRRNSAESVLGKSIREALPELEGQGFFELLDGVYQTGVPYLGKEVPGSLRCEDTGDLEDAFFDFTYQPIRGSAGQVEGIMVQATDVTDRVKARQELARREQIIQAQWTELQAVYRSAAEGEAEWSEDQSTISATQEAKTSIPPATDGTPSRVMSAERVSGSVVVTFDDGRCALYTAALLKRVFPQAEELF